MEESYPNGKKTRYKQFLLFPQCFQKACFPGASKGVTVWEWVNKELIQISPFTLAGPKYLCEEGSIRLSNVDETGIIYADLSSNDAKYDNPCIVKIESCSACQVEIIPEPERDFDFFCRTGVLKNSYCSLG